MTKMIKQAYPAREFMQFTPRDVFASVKGVVPILFEDGVVIDMKDSEIVFNRYMWDLVALADTMAKHVSKNKQVKTTTPIFKIKSDYNITNYYRDGYFTEGSLLTMLSTIYKDVVSVVFKADITMAHHNMEEFFRGVYRVVTNLYGSLSSDVNDHIISFNIIDLLDIQLNPKLMEAIDVVRKEQTKESVKACYDVLDDLIRNDKTYSDNPVTLAYISGLVNQNQVRQVLGPRGFVTDIDSRIFKHPIASSFTIGMQTVYEQSVESRSGVKSLYFSSKYIQQSEYLARELQLVTMVVRKIVMTDCGSKRHINWFVKESDLKNLVGSRYFDDDGIERVITADDKHLVGKTIRKRSALTCQLENKEHVCSACFGDLSFNIPKHTNIGHMSSTVLSAKVSQNLLSTKHLIVSANVDVITLDKVASKFFTVKQSNGYGMRHEFMRRSNGIKLVIDSKECYGLKDIRSKESVGSVNPERVTRISTMEVIHGDDRYTVVVKRNNRYGVFTSKMLMYIVEAGFEIDERGNYVIDMSRWRSKSSFLDVPEIEYSFEVFASELREIFTDKKLNSNSTQITPEGFLMTLFDKVNSRLSINVSLLEIIAYAFSVYDRENSNFDLSRNSPTPGVANLNTVISKRSAGAIYAHGGIASKVIMPSIFSGKNTPDHILDVLVKPTETLSVRGVE